MQGNIHEKTVAASKQEKSVAAGAEEKTVELPQGRIHYREQGVGEPIVFVHGLLVDGRLWRDATPHLADSYRCIVPDWPLGSHRTALAPGTDRSPRGMAHLVADFLQVLELENVTIVGNDTGGAISQILASERPERLRALVLTNCDCLENFLPPMVRPLQWMAHVPGAYRLMASAGQSPAMRRSPLGFGMLAHRPIPDELTGAWLAPMRRPEIRADMIATLKAIHRRDTLRPPRPSVSARCRPCWRGHPMIGSSRSSSPSACGSRSPAPGWSGSTTAARSSPSTSPSGSPM